MEQELVCVRVHVRMCVYVRARQCRLFKGSGAVRIFSLHVGLQIFIRTFGDPPPLKLACQ